MENGLQQPASFLFANQIRVTKPVLRPSHPGSETKHAFLTKFYLYPCINNQLLTYI